MPYVVFVSAKRVGNKILLLFQPQNVENRFVGRRPTIPGLWAFV